MNNNTQKGFAMPVIIAAVAVALVLSGIVYYANKSNEANKMAEEKAMTEKEAMEQKETGVMMDKKDQDGEVMQKDDGGMMDKGETMMKYVGATLAGKSAPLLDFTKADYDAAIKTDKLVVLYFYANWCPICKMEFPVMQKVFNELTTDTIIGFRVNYNDDQTDADEKNLARQFGIAYQHTKVFVKNGQKVLKSPEGWNQNRYETEINKALGQ